MSDYTDQRARTLLLATREVLKELPDACSEFIQSIADTTQPLTRYVYATDLRIFCRFLMDEVPSFARYPSMVAIPHEAFGEVTARQIRNYMEYLGFYISNDEERTNTEPGKTRKLSSLRSFYEYLVKSEAITSDPSRLVDMPKRHEKPILRMEIDEAARMLDLVESGEALADEHQRKYNEHTKLRDLAILTLFLGTGIRVSELVGLDLNDIDFNVNGFLVTRKGGNQAILYFPDEVANVLKRYINEVRLEETPLPGHEDALFLSLQKKRMGVRSVQMMVK